MIGSSVFKDKWTADADAEHTTFMRDLEYVQAADKAGFKYAWIPEHHFLDEYSHMSAPEPFLGYLAHATERIHLGSGIFNPLPPVNHPVKVAEKVAMLDHLTEGRFEFGTGRGAGSHEIIAFLEAFGVTETNETKAIWEDVISEFPKMWLQKIYEGHSSQYWSLPPRQVLPKPWGKAHPAMWYAAGNPSSWEMAGRKGLGVLGFAVDTLDKAALAIGDYKKAIGECEPVGAFVNDNLMAAVFAIVSEDRERAYDVACSPVVPYLSGQLYRYHDTFPRPAAIPQYPEMPPQFEREQMPELVEMGSIIGDPDDALRVCQRWADTGLDQLCIAVGMYGPEPALEVIDVFGKYIIPKLDLDPEHSTTRFRRTAAA